MYIKAKVSNKCDININFVQFVLIISQLFEIVVSLFSSLSLFLSDSRA